MIMVYGDNVSFLFLGIPYILAVYIVLLRSIWEKWINVGFYVVSLGLVVSLPQMSSVFP